VSAQFLAISSALTGFDEADLQGTGLVDAYLYEVQAVIGDVEATAFIGAGVSALLAGDGDPARTDAALAALLAHPRFGPVARNVITMWYLGTWSRMPDGWYGDRPRNILDVDRVISAQAYVESLVWRAAGTHPPGAKQPGFGSWSLAPATEPER
jgi:hypothetical protein